MQESVKRNNLQALIDSVQHSLSFSGKTLKSSVILPALSTLKEKDLKKFWNWQCQVLQSNLWLPQETGLPDRDSLSSKVSLNYQVDQSESWMTRITPLKNSTLRNLSVLLPHSVIATTKRDPLRGAKVIASKKIRFYPENESAYFDALSLYRRSYNLAVERFKNNTFKDDSGKFINLRPAIKDQVKREQEASGRAYNSIISDNGTLAATTAFKAVCSRNKKLKGSKSGFSELNFKSKKGGKHSFSIDRLPKGLNPCVKTLGKITLTEQVPDEAINKSCVITHDKSRWYIQVQKHIELKTEIQGEVRCVGIDPGIRTFATCFSDKEVIIAGDKLSKEKLFPLMKQADEAIKGRQKVFNEINKIFGKSIKFVDMPQWARDRIKHYNMLINKLYWKKKDLVSDLHRRLAYYLVTNYDVIFLPEFETKSMVKRSKGDKVRTIRRNTCRQMMSLCHYEFKLTLKWYAKKYGKHVADCNEAYTSKTRSWDGSIDHKLGSKEYIYGVDSNNVMFRVGRDINSSRNILLKNLTRVA